MISQLCHIFLFDFTSHISCKQDMPYDVWVSTLFFPIFHCLDFTNFICKLNSPKISYRQFNIQCPGLKCLGFCWPVNRRQNSAHHWRDTRQSTFLDFQRYFNISSLFFENVNVNLIICSGFCFCYQVPMFWCSSEPIFHNVNVIHFVEMLLKAAWPCPPSTCFTVQDDQNSAKWVHNSADDIVRAVTTNIIRQARPGSVEITANC